MRLLMRIVSLFAMLGIFQFALAQPTPTEKETRNTTGAWFGFFSKYQFNDKWAYHGEYHVRLRNGFHDMAQIYLRFGATYKVKQYFDVTAGFVHPYYWAPHTNDPNIDKVVPQYRLWQQGVLATPFNHIIVLHQLRTEQRWARNYVKGSPYDLTHRFRYKLTTYIPLNKPAFEERTLFLSLYEEIFIQAGKSIVFNHFEDNRIYAGLGYNFNEVWQVQAGYMNTFRHDGAPYKYEFRHLLRLSVYHHLHLHLDKHRIMDVPAH
jgi:hypothetical protein